MPLARGAVRQALEIAARAKLLVALEAVTRILNDAARHPGRLETAHDVVAVELTGPRLDLAIERISIGEARLAGRQRLALRPRRISHRLAKPAPLVIVADGDRHPGIVPEAATRAVRRGGRRQRSVPARCIVATIAPAVHRAIEHRRARQRD